MNLIRMQLERLLRLLTSHHTSHPLQTRHITLATAGEVEINSQVFLWTPTHGPTSISWPAKLSMRTFDAVCRSGQERWSLGTDSERKSTESVLSARIWWWFQNHNCPVGWGCTIHWLHLCRGVRTPLPNECPGYDTKQSDGEVPVMLGPWEIRSTPSLPLLPGPLWPDVVAPDRVLSMV